jgi:hypothetical protein
MHMSKLVSMIVALGLACAFTAPAFAADVTKAKTEADCTKAGGVWDAKSKTCKPKM